MMTDDQKQSQMLPIGTLLQDGRYRVECHIASGGFGNTYEVVHTRLGKHHAMKEFFMRGINQRKGSTVSVSVEDNRTTFSQMRDKFLKEAQRLACLEDPHIVEVSDFFEENHTAYYVMRLIRGKSLAASMKEAGCPFSEQEVLDVLPQVLSALNTVHAQGLYHLDLKPGNIMRNAQGHCWLIDFGASKQMSATESQTLSTSTGLCYTPGYAPSEQISGNIKRIGPWTDFYALGATIFNLLTNQQPPEVDDVRFDGESAFSFPDSVSLQMRQLVFWLMQSDYPKRPQNVEEIEQRLSAFGSARTVVSKKKTLPDVVIPKPASVETVLHNSVEKNKTEEESEQIDLYPMREGGFLLWGGKWGFADKNGRIVIPCQWKSVAVFSEGLALVENENDKCGFINKEGKYISPCQWYSACSFHEGLAVVENEDRKFGYIDRTGKLVIPCKWRDAFSFQRGKARVLDGVEELYIDKTGKVLNK